MCNCHQWYERTIYDIDKQPLSTSLSALLNSKLSIQKDAQSKNNVAAFLQKIYTTVTEITLVRTTSALALSALLIVIFFKQTLISREIVLTKDHLNSIEVTSVFSQIAAGEKAEISIGTLQEILAFYRQDGVVCKYFSLKSKNAILAVSCFENETWKNVAFNYQQAQDTDDSSYHLASGNDDESIERYITLNKIGDVLSVEQEKQVFAK